MVNQHEGSGPASGPRPGERRPGSPPYGERAPGAAEPASAEPGFGRRHWRALAIIAAVLIAFLVGFVWQFVRAQRAIGELEGTRIELEFSRMEATLGAAAVAAEYGHYESGRVLSSRFFTSLTDRTGHPRVEEPDQMRAIMAQRDETITALSRGSPASAEMLAQLLIRFRVGLNGPEHAIPLPGTDEPVPQP